MQPNQSTFSLICRIAAKEISLFFSSPTAYLFLGSFVAITLFVFFWIEGFFARNIADIRPLFEWMPVLLIFLSSTLTMRLWSEERRVGTLEYVLSQPTPLWQFVVGKFIACLALLCIALLMTLPLPISIEIIADLDWGPVLGGYLATLLLGAAYLSIGLFASARSENQIVSLISATMLCGLFYLIGSDTITDFFGNTAGEWLRLLGTASRFETITRGMIDLRDLYYYLSIISLFLVLNTYVLEKERWADKLPTPHHQHWRRISLLLCLNILIAHLWLGQIHALRVDTTQGRQYSLSQVTKDYLSRLQEPLLIRAYFSSKTHPLLAPLVPQLKDLIEEYRFSSHGKVRTEFIDPITEPELEQQANQKYGIQPVPFQVEDRYQSAIVNSYFDILIQYGDEYETLGFQDLIDIKIRNETDIEVMLRNPEYDLTRTIKKVLHDYQASGDLFTIINEPLTLTAYISADDVLPASLIKFRNLIQPILEQAQKKSAGQLSVQFIDPASNDGQIAKQITQDYGLQPMATSLFTDTHFYFYLVLRKGEQTTNIPLDDLTQESFERNLKAGIKRFSHGFTKTIALASTADHHHSAPQFGVDGARFRQLEKLLSTELNIKKTDLETGHMPGEADLLLLAAPHELNKRQLFAVDQFLMQGGTVVVSTSPYTTSLNNQHLFVQEQKNELLDWLAHHGIKLEKKLVMDPENSAFPIPVTRNIGGFQLQEIRMLDYPYFINVHGKGLSKASNITAELSQITMPWASPIILDQDRQEDYEITELLHSSERAWLSTSTNVMPRIDERGYSAFKPEGEQGKHLLGVVLAGRFDSYFTESPLLAEGQEAGNSDDKADDEGVEIISSVIQHSPSSARIVLFSSNTFLNDQFIQLATSARRNNYLSPLQLIANTIDWALEDANLAGIRGRGHFNRTLPQLSHRENLFWEYINYLLALLLLGMVALIRHQQQTRLRNVYLQQFTK